nr:polysaccharide biosynthesis tyrosine autokinase [Rhodopila sp.]
DFKRHEKFEAIQRAHDWFQEQMGKLALEVSEADRAVQQYRLEHGLDELPPDDGAPTRAETLNRQLLNAVNVQLAQATQEIAQKEGRLAQAEAALRGKVSLNALPEIVASPRITELSAQLATVAGHEAQLASTQGAGNPELASVRAQRGLLQSRLATEAANIVKSLTAEINADHAQEQSLRQQVEKLRAKVSAENLALMGLQVPLTKARATRSIYETFLNRATQLANVSGIQEQDATLVSGARPPLGPSAPKSSRLIAVAALLSTVLGVALACVIERMRSGFSVPEQVEATLGLPLIAAVPEVPRAVLNGRRSGRPGVALAAALDRLQGKVRVQGNTRPKVMMITSALPKEGKSTLAAVLARNVAAAGLKVLLVECDFHCPELARKFRLPPQPGLCEILATGLPDSSTQAIHEVAPGLHVIAAGSCDRDAQELLASEAMNMMLRAMQTRYDLVLLDTPPVLARADALVLAQRADATLVVLRWEKTARTPVQDAVRLLQESRAPILGVVMTRVDRRTAGRLGGRLSYAFRLYDTYRHARLYLK